mmetsp:Transcript_39681/g.66594  ORF Transcript_39681/g.66594 Transcript_39681/m.66594 type:complete len:273 (-) Transcript_39681:1299-2117(-)
MLSTRARHIGQSSSLRAHCEHATRWPHGINAVFMTQSSSMHMPHKSGRTESPAREVFPLSAALLIARNTSRLRCDHFSSACLSSSKRPLLAHDDTTSSSVEDEALPCSRIRFADTIAASNALRLSRLASEVSTRVNASSRDAWAVALFRCRCFPFRSLSSCCLWLLPSLSVATWLALFSPPCASICPSGLMWRAAFLPVLSLSPTLSLLPLLEAMLVSMLCFRALLELPCLEGGARFKSPSSAATHNAAKSFVIIIIIRMIIAIAIATSAVA